MFGQASTHTVATGKYINTREWWREKLGTRQTGRVGNREREIERERSIIVIVLSGFT